MRHESGTGADPTFLSAVDQVAKQAAEIQEEATIAK